MSVTQAVRSVLPVVIIFYSNYKETEFKTLEEIVELINGYVRSRSFTLVNKKHGRCQILDPNGQEFTDGLPRLSAAKKNV